MTDGKLLKEKIDASGLKISFIASQLGITPQGFYLKLNGTNDFKVSEVKKLCELLNLTRLKERDAIFFADNVDG